VTEFYIRTEDIKPDKVLDLYVPSHVDEELVRALKSTEMVVLEGSRGTGKSFLLKVAQAELLRDYSDNRVLPVYVTFWWSSMIQTAEPDQFQYWMMSRLCSEIVFALKAQGIVSESSGPVQILAGKEAVNAEVTKIEQVARCFEDSYKKPGNSVDVSSVPTIEQFHRAVEEICKSHNIERLVIYFDEAAHIFRPAQQRAFFSLFRDLRSPYIRCKAAIYPGVTSFGDTFQPTHDADWLRINRDVLADDYIEQMKQIIQGMADEKLTKMIDQHGEHFSLLAYAASGNPRLLIKTVKAALTLSSKEIDKVFREFYRSNIWSEHSQLVNDYPGHVTLIDWGRKFIETSVLPQLKRRNDRRLDTQREESTNYFHVARGAPQGVHQALQLLSYIGVVSKDAEGIKSKKEVIGTRYSVNLGCLFSQEGDPSKTAFKIAKDLSTRRYVEFAANSPEYDTVNELVKGLVESDVTLEILQRQLDKPIDVLDITEWQHSKLIEHQHSTIRSILEADEEGLQQIFQIGERRARSIMNAALSSVLEYLSG
jgi:Cdc6-like AAA superfamily ATPase